MKVASSNRNIAEDTDNENSDSSVAEQARQKDAKLIEALEYQVIMDTYQYGSTTSISNQENGIVDPLGESRSTPKHTPQQHQASALPQK